MTRDIKVNAEIVNKYIGTYNEVIALNIPDGVSVYLSLKEIYDMNDGELLTDYLKIKKGVDYAQSQRIYLNTKGTSAQDLRLRVNAIESNEIYFDTKQKETLSLEDKIVFEPKNAFEYSILSGEFEVIDTSNIKAVRFLADNDINVSLNDSSIKYPMLEDMIFTKNLNSLKFSNDSGSSINIVLWSM